MDGWSLVEVGGQVVGGAVGVVIGYAASEFASAKQRRRDDLRARDAVNMEMLSNANEAAAIRRAITRESGVLPEQVFDDDSAAINERARAFINLREPLFEFEAWALARAQSPGAIGRGDIGNVTAHYRSVREIMSIWNEYSRAREREREPLRPGVVSVLGSPAYFSDAARRLQVELEQALVRAAEKKLAFGISPLDVGRDLAREMGWRGGPFQWRTRIWNLRHRWRNRKLDT